ncbi:hypothetical protein R3P38DRAFT_3273232 [Favolaschia claudopus]|uniref:Uncharacterized protein n=1 Tax=Favolaschia claudopus TaxID=2862362 RepID=A0AAW0B4P3_9AGAR
MRSDASAATSSTLARAHTYIQKELSSSPPHLLSPNPAAAIAIRLDPDFHRSTNIVTAIPPSTRDFIFDGASARHRPRRRFRVLPPWRHESNTTGADIVAPMSRCPPRPTQNLRCKINSR